MLKSHYGTVWKEKRHPGDVIETRCDVLLTLMNIPRFICGMMEQVKGHFSAFSLVAMFAFESRSVLFLSCHDWVIVF